MNSIKKKGGTNRFEEFTYDVTDKVVGLEGNWGTRPKTKSREMTLEFFQRFSKDFGLLHFDTRERVT